MDFFQDPSLQLLILAGVVVLLGWLAKSTPTRLTWIALLLPIPVLFLGFYWPGIQNGLLIYDGLFLTVLGLDRFWFSRELTGLTVERRFSQKFSLAQENPVTLEISNPGSQPLQGRLADQYPEGMSAGQAEHSFRVEPLERQTLQYSLIPHQRGRFEFGMTFIKHQSRLGFLWIRTQGAQRETVKVYPNLKRLQALRVRYSQSINLGVLKRRRSGVEGTLFEGLQSYGAGDDVKKIDWRATARLDTPIIRRFTTEVDQPIMLLLDAGRKMQSRIDSLSKLDWALNALFAFAGVALDQGDQVGVGVFDEKIRWMVPLGGGKNQLQQVVERCHDLKPTEVEPDYEAVMLQFAARLKRRSCVVIFTDLIDPMVSQSLMRSIRVFSPHHLVLILTFSDPAVKAMETQYPETVEAAYEKGVALDLNQLRQRSLNALQSGRGAVVIDAPPHQLDENLITQYLSIKLHQKL